MPNTTHTHRNNLSLRFSAVKRIKLTFSRIQKTQMYLLWLRFRHYSTVPLINMKGNSLRITDLYRYAFEKFLFVNKIPKIIPKIDRKQFELNLDEPTVEMLEGMRKIALKRNQPLSVVVEEALQAYLDLPENYLGKDLQKPGHQERIG